MHLWALPGALGEGQGLFITEASAQGRSLGDWQWGALMAGAKHSLCASGSTWDFSHPATPPISQVSTLRPALSETQQIPVTPPHPFHPAPWTHPQGWQGAHLVHGECGLLVVLPGGTELQERVMDAEKRDRGGL